MSKSRDEVTVDFDHHRSPRLLDLSLAYSALRGRCPVAWSKSHGGFWIVTRYDDVDRVLKDYRYFTSTDGPTIPGVHLVKGIPADIDPPDHTKYRRALNPLLTREAVQEKMEPRIGYWTTVFVDRVIETGECDLMADLAVAVPAAVTLEWLGWENREEWWPVGAAWHDLLGRRREDPRFQQAIEFIERFDLRLAEELERRRVEPRGDPMSAIVALEIEGRPITREEALSITRLLINAGLDTTTIAIGYALVHLHYFLGDRERLGVADRELWETATDEFLRRYSPVRAFARTCVEEIELDGCPIRPGERVLASVDSANQDEDVFSNPLGVQLDRSPNRHLAFGSGIHRCIGLHLARAEFMGVLRAVLERMPDYRLVEDELVEYPRQSETGGWFRAPATFTPGRRLLPESADSLVMRAVVA
jgi:cytochrome P450